MCSNMGSGRTAATFGTGSKDGSLADVAPREIQTTAYLPGSRTAFLNGGPSYKDTILEAQTDGSGNLTFRYARPVEYPKPAAKTNKTATATFEVAHGAINGTTFGIVWDKVQSISGQTYSLRTEARNAGLTWDPNRKVWKR